jgi:glycosyltransferase involved in cell wall biosynthesis
LIYADSPIFSGAEAVLCDVAASLSRAAAMTVTCAVPHANQDFSEKLAELTGSDPIDVPAQPLPAAAFHLLDPRRRRRVAQALSVGTWDAMLVNLPSAELGATPLSVRRRPPALGLLHIAGSFKQLGFRLGGARERVARRALRRLDRACVLSESARETYAEVWGGDRGSTSVVRLPRPRVEVVERSVARARLGLPAAPLVGVVGRISFKQKGQDTFARAAGLLAASRPELHFAVAGEGRDAERLSAIVGELGLADRFHLLGQVEGAGAFLSALDAIAIPSHFEGLPLVALEALEIGVPGVAADVDGLRDVWPAPWRVPAGDASALAAKLGQVLDSGRGRREELLATGRAAAARRTTDDLAAEFEPLLRGLAA